MNEIKAKLNKLSAQLKACSKARNCINCERRDHYSSTISCVNDLVLEASELLEKAAVSAGWIYVKDKMPEDDDRLEFHDDGRMQCTTVLAYTEYGRIIPKNRLIVKPTGNEYLDKQVTDGWIWASGTENVTHWMPLPTPPEKK